MVVHLMLLRSGGGSCEVLAEGHDCVHGILIIINLQFYMKVDRRLNEI